MECSSTARYAFLLNRIDLKFGSERIRGFFLYFCQAHIDVPNTSVPVVTKAVLF